MKLCFVVCDHGLGHMRRVASVANELADAPGHSVTIFGRPEQAGVFDIDVTKFATCTTVPALTAGCADTCRWHERLPDLGGYDVVVSDNLPEILELREDALLMGSFLWHLALDDVEAGYRRTAERLLARYRPMMIGTGLFASPEVKQATRYVDVGLFRDKEIPAAAKTDLLVSCGLSANCVLEAQGLVEELLSVGPGQFHRVHVEPRLLPPEPPDWMAPADFTPRMFSTVAAAVIRPGVGTATELLQAGAPMFCFHEPGNRELEFNARQIARYGFGSSYPSARDALAAALDDGVIAARTVRNAAGLRFDGARQAARLLEGMRTTEDRRSTTQK